MDITLTFTPARLGIVISNLNRAVCMLTHEVDDTEVRRLLEKGR